MHNEKNIFRVAVDGLHCRSSVELVELKVAAIDGVEAASVGSENVLTVFADADAVSPDDIIRTLIDAGVSPAGPVELASVAVETVEIVATVAEEPAPESESLVPEVEEEVYETVPVTPVPASPRASLVQRVRVAVTDAYYPDRLEVIPGVPVEIEFGEGHGCLSRVTFDELGIDEDLTQGGATVRLPGLAPGTYAFSCGMDMVHGTVIAEA